MPAYYFDTSAMAKRYVVAVGSAWVQAIVAQQSGQTIYTSVLTQPELVSALQRRVREGFLEAPEAERLAQQVHGAYDAILRAGGDHAIRHHAGLYSAAQAPATGVRCAALGVRARRSRGDRTTAVGRAGVCCSRCHASNGGCS